LEGMRQQKTDKSSYKYIMLKNGIKVSYCKHCAILPLFSFCLRPKFHIKIMDLDHEPALKPWFYSHITGFLKKKKRELVDLFQLLTPFPYKIPVTPE
jgi:hypothetical protein